MMFFFFKQKTAYEMRISDWSSDVSSSDLPRHRATVVETLQHRRAPAVLRPARKQCGRQAGARCRPGILVGVDDLPGLLRLLDLRDHHPGLAVDIDAERLDMREIGRAHV